MRQKLGAPLKTAPCRRLSIYCTRDRMFTGGSAALIMLVGLAGYVTSPAYADLAPSGLNTHHMDTLPVTPSSGQDTIVTELDGNLVRDMAKIASNGVASALSLWDANHAHWIARQRPRGQ